MTGHPNHVADEMNEPWEDPHADFLNALMEGACDCFDGDESMEDLALRYVRHLESMLSAAARCVRTFEDSCYYVPEPSGGAA